MADVKDKHNSFEEIGLGIGQNTDGTFNVFPSSELAAKIAERDSAEAAGEYADAEVFGVDVPIAE